MAAALRTTDAGDFAIGPAHTSVPSTKSTVQTTVAQSPIFGIPAKLEVSLNPLTIILNQN